MGNRREFTRAVKIAIIKRSMRDGSCFCEGCGALAMRGEVHHIQQDAMEIDKSRKLTAEDGLYLCIPCHREISDKQAGELAKVQRVEARHLGIRGKSKFPQRPKPPRSTAKVDSIRALRRWI